MPYLVTGRRPPEAERYLKQALDMQRNSVDVLNTLAALYVATGRYDEAEQTFGRSLSLNSDQPERRAILEQIRVLE